MTLPRDLTAVAALAAILLVAFPRSSLAGTSDPGPDAPGPALEMQRVVEESATRWRALRASRPWDDDALAFSVRLAEAELQRLRALAAASRSTADAGVPVETRPDEALAPTRAAARLLDLLAVLEARAAADLGTTPVEPGTTGPWGSDGEATLTGRVLDADGLPVEGAVVSVSREDGAHAGLALTDRLGEYRLTGLGPGPADVVVRGPGIVPMIRGERACALGCVRLGPALELPTSGVAQADFRGTGGASIGGVVRDAVTTAPIEVAVYAFVGSSFAGFDTSDPSTGLYEITDLASGVEHYVRTNGATAHVDEVWDDVPCPGGGCQAFQVGSPVTPVEGEPPPEADFDLLKGGFLEVTVTDADTAAGVSGASIFISEDGYATDVAGVTTDSGGLATSPPIVPGDYYVGATAASYVAELHDSVHCFHFGGCDPASATQLGVQAEQQTSVSIALDVGASIAGVVRDEETTDPISPGQVILFDDGGEYVEGDLLSGGGGFLFTQLPAGTYFVATQVHNSTGHFDETYDDIPFSFPDVTSGTPVAVELGELVANIDFDLALGGGFEGTLRTDDEIPLAWEYLRVFDGTTTTIERADGEGNLRVRPLDPGTYFVSTALDDSNYLEEMWQDVPCDGYLDCDWSLADPIVVVATDVVTGIDIRVARSSRIQGTVIAADGGAPVAGATIGAAGEPNRATSAADGTFTLAGLQPGSYQVWASHPDFQRQSLGGDYCPETTCENGLGDVVVLGPEQTATGVDFALETGGVVEGTLTARVSEEPVGGAILFVYDDTGRPMEGATSAADGTWRTAPMPTDGPVPVSIFIAPDGYLRETHLNTRATFGFLNQQPLQVLQGDPLVFGPTAELTVDLALDVVADAHQMTFEIEVVGGGRGLGAGTVGDGWETCDSAICTYESYPDGATFDLVAAPGPGYVFLGWSADPDCLDGTVTLTSDLTCRATFEDRVEIFVDGFESGSTSAWSSP